MSLKPYNVNDDPGREDHDYCWWALVWAEDERQAESIARRHYAGDGPQDCELVVKPVTADLSAWSPIAECPECYGSRGFGGLACIKCFGTGAIAELGMEYRPNVLRLAGWKEPGETACEKCGLFALGESEWGVCPECCLCGECGCDCGDIETSEVVR